MYSCDICGWEDITILPNKECYCPACECIQPCTNEEDTKEIVDHIHNMADEACESIDNEDNCHAKQLVIRINELVGVLENYIVE